MQFHRALNRRPLPEWPRYAGASGPLKGISGEEWNDTEIPIPWEVVVLCTSSDHPVAVFTAMNETVDTHGAIDLLNISEVKDSWAHAARLNVEYGN